MFERFTEGARQVVVLAQEESRLLGHDYIGTEHLLLGVLRQDDEAVGAAFAAHGVALEPVREQVVQLVGRGRENFTGQIPFTPRAKKVLELSLREAQELGHNVIAPFHIAIALAREADGVAAHILRDHGLDPPAVERALGGQVEKGLGADIYRKRLDVVEARLMGWQRRAELIDLVAGSQDGKEAEARVAERFGVSPELARQILIMRVEHFTAAEIAKLRQEREDLLNRLGD